MTPPKPATPPDLTPCIAKVAAKLEESIEANSPRNACSWLELFNELTKAVGK